MPRKLRVEYPGAIDHVMSRANGTGNIFETDVDRQDFIKTLAETCQKTGFHRWGRDCCGGTVTQGSSFLATPG